MSAKQLLAAYDIQPPPKIIEVDIRGGYLDDQTMLTTTYSFCDADDGSMIKHLLTRLTHRSTFPNILFRGKSMGGSDDLNQLHANKKLGELIEEAGATPRSDGSAK